MNVYCVCVRACARAHVCACVCARARARLCVSMSVCVCVCLSVSVSPSVLPRYAQIFFIDFFNSIHPDAKTFPSLQTVASSETQQQGEILHHLFFA